MPSQLRAFAAGGPGIQLEHFPTFRDSHFCMVHALTKAKLAMQTARREQKAGILIKGAVEERQPLRAQLTKHAR